MTVFDRALGRVAVIFDVFNCRYGAHRPPRGPRGRRVRPGCVALEDRIAPAFAVTASNAHEPSSKFVASLNQPVGASTLDPAELIVDGSQPGMRVNGLHAQTIEFVLPAP